MAGGRQGHHAFQKAACDTASLTLGLSPLVHRLKVQLHNERRAAGGDRLKPTDLNFPYNWDLSQPHVVAKAGQA